MNVGTNPVLATLLTPKIGFLKAAEIAHESRVKQKPIRDLAVEKGILTKEEADAMFDLRTITWNRYRQSRK
jgi:aspartate ammonia-lyase